jgi:hypothetical protein
MAYKQNFGKPASKGDGQTFQDNGLVSPMHKDKKKDITSGTSTRPNSDITTGDRPKGAGRSYSNENKATRSTEGTIGGNKPFSYRHDNKTYKYVPGAQNNNPKTGRKL